jgi:hypothetical protein
MPVVKIVYVVVRFYVVLLVCWRQRVKERDRTR